MNTSTQHTTDVIIVGAGPVGLTLAAQLTSAGISCRLFEKRVIASQHSKALSISAGSLNIFAHMNIVEEFLSLGKKVENIYIHWLNQRFMHINYRKLVSPFPFFLSLPQPKTEKILAKHLNRLGQEIERDQELIDINLQSQHISATFKRSDGCVEHCQSRYLIACDGSKSAVRVKLGIAFEGHNYSMYFRLIDVYLDWQGPCDDTHYFVKEDGFIIVIPMAGEFHRIVIKESVTTEENRHQSLSCSTYQTLIDNYGPGKIKLKKIIWESCAPFYNRLIKHYQYQQRIFFVGDAAHLFSPIGGQGMNTGLQDAHNLAWKLAGVIKKNWSTKILATYEHERRFIASQLIKSTDETTRLIARIKPDDKNLITAWLPINKNRERIRTMLPSQFSGLSQCYELSPFVNNLNQAMDSEHLLNCLKIS